MGRMKASVFTTRAKAQTIHPHSWLWEPLESEPSFLLKPMFGARSVYLDGQIVLCFSARSEPWRGVLIPTDRERHAGLLAEFPMLSPHPILPKWLYLAESDNSFEAVAPQLVALVKARDPRIGVFPKAKKRLMMKLF